MNFFLWTDDGANIAIGIPEYQNTVIHMDTRIATIRKNNNNKSHPLIAD